MAEINNRIEEVKKLYGIVADELSQFIDEFKVDVRKPHKWQELSAGKKAYWQNRFSQLFPQPLDEKEEIFREIYESEVLDTNYAPATWDWEKLQLKHLGSIKFPMKDRR